MSLELLQSNLQELYTAVHRDGEPALMADLFGSRVYDAGAGWGKVWSWCGSAYFKPDGLQTAIRYTHQLFQQQLQDIAKVSNEYRLLQEQIQVEEHIPESTIAPIRNKLIEWFEATDPFLKILKTNQKLKTLLQKYLPKTEEPFFSCGQLKKQLQWQKSIVRLESMIGGTLPLNVLLLTSLRSPLNEGGNKKFLKFVGKINRIQTSLQVQDFHKAMQAANEIRQRTLHTSNVELVELEMALFNKGCTIFNTTDDIHLVWRKTLREGDKLLCNGREVIVGERIGAKPNPDEDDNWIFMVQNDPNIVLSIGINRTSHLLKEKLGHDYSWGIQPAKYIDIDRKGRFALIERLYDPVDGYKWKSQEKVLDLQDKTIAEPIAGLLKWFIEEEKTPLHFDPKYLLFTKEGILRCVKIPLESRFNFMAMVEFVKCCAKENQAIFTFIVQTSGMNQHDSAIFLKEVVRYTVEGRSTDVADIAKARKVDSRVIERGEGLRKEAVTLRQRCLLHIYQDYETRNVNNTDIEREIGNCILSQYIEDCNIGSFSAGIEEQVVRQVVQSMQLQLRFGVR